MRRLTGVLAFILCIPCAQAISVAPQSASGDTVITLNPATPALNETFTLTVRGTWSDGCVPQFQSVGGSGSTIQINAVANPNCISGCAQALTAYSLTTSPGMITAPGIYTVEYYVTECTKPKTLVKSQTIAISSACQFDRSLTVSPTAVRVGSSTLLRWCDPSVNPTAEGGVRVNFFRILAARSSSGPFVPIGDIQGFNGVGINFDANDVGPAFFFVEAHECQVTMGNCTGDTVVRSNIVRVDVASATGCLPDGMTLCLNGGRFQVTANWRTPDGNSGRGNAVALADDSGYFWFFGPNNVEVVVKALNACTQPAPRYWVFASGLTNVAVDLTVTDTKSGAVKTYSNPMGQAFQPIQDTGAFSTCP